jgi:type VI protein secretion system component VasK
MLKSWMRDLTLSLKASSGVTPAFLAWLAIVAGALVTAFVFLCITGYDWLSRQLGSVYAGLIMAGFFLLIALIGLIVTAVSRRRAKERAILERAARAQAASSTSLIDPKILGLAVQAGRAQGWQRIVPIAILGFLAAQWVWERRSGTGADDQS